METTQVEDMMRIGSSMKRGGSRGWWLGREKDGEGKRWLLQRGIEDDGRKRMRRWSERNVEQRRKRMGVI